MSTDLAEPDVTGLVRTTPIVKGQPRLPELAEPGRVCAAEGCSTILRRTNRGDACALHALAAPVDEPDAELYRGPLQAKDRLLAEAAVRPGTAVALAERAGVRQKYARELLSRMHAAGEIHRTGRPGTRSGNGYVYGRKG